MVFAKTSKAASRLSEEVRSRQLKKEYLVVVDGKFEKNKDTLEDYLLKNQQKNISRVVKEGTKNSKLAKLDYETLKYNTAISSLMSMLNEYDKYKDGITKDDYRVLLHLLNPDAPHITEELNEQYNLGKPLCESAWPIYDEAKTIDKEITIGVQINGKLRSEVTLELNESEELAKDKVLNQDNVKKYIDEKEIVKFIYIPNKIINIIVK